MTDMPHSVKYPLGIQTFSNIIEEGYLYLDKTEYLYQMTHAAKYVFLSRPRRFGKSLLTSTLRSYFEGRKELFKGLAIEQLEKEWMPYPVLHLSLAGAKHLTEEKLIRYLQYILDENARRFGVNVAFQDVNLYLKRLIEELFVSTGKPVVVLIDEYDAPLLDVIHEDREFPLLRNVMRDFYSPLKDCDPMLKFVFLTGITKFSQLSLFPELNNIRNITMDRKFAAICGITERITDIVPLLYQSDYLTIKGYDDLSELYTLDLPNREIRIGLMRQFK